MTSVSLSKSLISISYLSINISLNIALSSFFINFKTQPIDKLNETFTSFLQQLPFYTLHTSFVKSFMRSYIFS